MATDYYWYNDGIGSDAWDDSGSDPLEYLNWYSDPELTALHTELPEQCTDLGGIYFTGEHAPSTGPTQEWADNPAGIDTTVLDANFDDALGSVFGLYPPFIADDGFLRLGYSGREHYWWGNCQGYLAEVYFADDSGCYNYGTIYLEDCAATGLLQYVSDLSFLYLFGSASLAMSDTAAMKLSAVVSIDTAATLTVGLEAGPLAPLIKSEYITNDGTLIFWGAAFESTVVISGSATAGTLVINGGSIDAAAVFEHQGTITFRDVGGAGYLGSGSSVPSITVINSDANGAWDVTTLVILQGNSSVGGATSLGCGDLVVEYGGFVGPALDLSRCGINGTLYLYDDITIDATSPAGEPAEYCLKSSRAGITFTGGVPMGSVVCDPNYPAVGNVRKNIAYDDGQAAGTCAVPAAANVRAGVAVDTTTGTLAAGPLRIVPD